MFTSHVRLARLALTLGTAWLCTGCGLLDSFGGEEDEGGLPAPPAAKIATAKPIQRPNAQRPAAGTPAAQQQRPAAQPQAAQPTPEPDDAGEVDGTESEEAEQDDTAAEPERSSRDDDDAEPRDKKKERALDADLFVKRLVIAKGVKSREPVGASNAFAAGAQDKIYAFVEVGNRNQVASEIYVTFVNKKNGKAMSVPLKVGAGSRWRTWVYTRHATKPGKWLAVVKNAKGKRLASAGFEVTGKGGEKKNEKATKKNEKATKKKSGEKKNEKATKKPQEATKKPKAKTDSDDDAPDLDQEPAPAAKKKDATKS
jgi:hypothetical protein